MENREIPNEKPVRRSALHQTAKDAPLNPGVYLMRDSEDGVLYVGKAKVLRNRLISYFQSFPHENPRIDLMVSRVERFEVILTETEAEALILEATLIKKYRPKFNIRLKDDKAYPYLKIQIHETFPRIEWTRRVLKDGARYFGPFPSAWAARQVMELLNSYFLLRDCSDNAFRHRSRPCILFQMGQCTAPCVGKVSAEDYRGTLQEVIAVLEGKSHQLVDELNEQMQEAAESEEYEEAAHYRDHLQNLQVVTAAQSAVEAGSFTDRDVIGFARQGSEVQGVVLIVRAGKLIAVKQFQLQNADVSQTEEEILSEFISQYYLLQTKQIATTPASDSPMPDGVLPAKVVILPIPLEDSDILEQVIGARILTPASGLTSSEASLESGGERVVRQLLNVAKTNAEHALTSHTKRGGGGHSLKALEEIQSKLHLERLPLRIECYDNSNIQGDDAVASRVVFIDGAPDKNLYRRYKIRSVIGADDFATMREVLGRRFSNSEEALPDLVVVDGGKGQLSQAVAILGELGISGVPVVGLAKARTEKDFRASEVKSSQERIFIPGRKKPSPSVPPIGSLSAPDTHSG
jgi:excinuclease ABC subunit C